MHGNAFYLCEANFSILHLSPCHKTCFVCCNTTATTNTYFEFISKWHASALILCVTKHLLSPDAKFTDNEEQEKCAVFSLGNYFYCFNAIFRCLWHWNREKHNCFLCIKKAFSIISCCYIYSAILIQIWMLHEIHCKVVVSQRNMQMFARLLGLLKTKIFVSFQHKECRVFRKSYHFHRKKIRKETKISSEESPTLSTLNIFAIVKIGALLFQRKLHFNVNVKVLLYSLLIHFLLFVTNLKQTYAQISIVNSFFSHWNFCSTQLFICLDSNSFFFLFCFILVFAFLKCLLV